MAQACSREGVDVTCHDGRHGMLSGDAIVWAGRHPIQPDAASKRHHRQQIIGRSWDRACSSAKAGGKGVVPLENPSSPYKQRCPVLDGVSYCY